MSPNRLVVAPRDLWAQAAADHIGEEIRQVLLAGPHARAAVALAGGRTPAPMYAELAGRFKSRLDWPRVDLFWSDERMVPPADAESNYRAVRESLLSRLSAEAPTVHAAPTNWEPMHAAAAYELSIRERVQLGDDRVPSFDLILLGVGEDGHTASLFPNSPLLSEASRLVAATTHPHSGQARLTFTPALLAAARQIVFLVSGEGKADILARVYDAPASPDLPVTIVAAAARDAVWIVDEDAAARLPSR